MKYPELESEFRFYRRPILYVGPSPKNGVTVSVVKPRTSSKVKGVRLTIVIDGVQTSVIMSGRDGINLASGLQGAARICGE